MRNLASWAVRWRCTPISCGMLVEHRRSILLSSQQLPRLLHVLEGGIVLMVLLSAEARLQDLQELGNVTSTSVSRILLIIAVHRAVFKETPGPTGGGGIKQSSRRWFPHLPPRCSLQPQFSGRHRRITLSFSAPFVSCSLRSSPSDG